MTDVVIYLDFDGTLTGRPGNDTVFKEFYQSLLEGYEEGKIQDYEKPLMKNPQEIQVLFEKKFGRYSPDMAPSIKDFDLLMGTEAVHFLQQVLANSDIRVTIVSRNRENYIKAMFAYQGFSEEEISKIKIYELADKSHSVRDDLEDMAIQENRHIYIFDDNCKDCERMVKATRWCGYLDNQIHQYNLEPGNFKWNNYLNDMLGKLSNIPQNNEKVTLSNTFFLKNKWPKFKNTHPAVPTPPVDEFEEEVLDDDNYSTSYN